MVKIKEEEEKGDDKGDEGNIVRIKVTRVTREKLKMIGNKGDSYDDVINAMFVDLNCFREVDR